MIAVLDRFCPTSNLPKLPDGGVCAKVDQTMNEEVAPNLTLDVQGMLCPLPVIKAKKSLKSLKAGDTLQVLTTDPVTLIDIPHMCRQFGHTLLQTRDTDTGHSFLIMKAS